MYPAAAPQILVTSAKEVFRPSLTQSKRQELPAKQVMAIQTQVLLCTCSSSSHVASTPFVHRTAVLVLGDVEWSDAGQAILGDAGWGHLQSVFRDVGQWIPATASHQSITALIAGQVDSELMHTGLSPCKNHLQTTSFRGQDTVGLTRASQTHPYLPRLFLSVTALAFCFKCWL